MDTGTDITDIIGLTVMETIGHTVTGLMLIGILITGPTLIDIRITVRIIGHMLIGILIMDRIMATGHIGPITGLVFRSLWASPRGLAITPAPGRRPLSSVRLHDLHGALGKRLEKRLAIAFG